MARIRSLLIDNTLGKIFTNTQSSLTADASKLIAGSKLLTASFTSAKTTTVKVISNLGTGKGILFPNSSLLTQITLSVATAPSGAPITVVIKKGTSYTTATVTGTYTIAADTLTSNYTVSQTINSGDSLFADVTTVGNVKSGVGLTILFNYYAG